MPGVATALVPGATILSLRTAPDSSEPGYQSFYTAANSDDGQQADANAIRYAARHGAGVILDDASTWSIPGPALLSAVNYALSRNVVFVTSTTIVGEPDSTYAYPTGIPGVIGVSDIDLPGGTVPTGPLPTGSMNNAVLISSPDNPAPALADWDIQGTRPRARSSQQRLHL